jgi:hypothetical protein
MENINIDPTHGFSLVVNKLPKETPPTPEGSWARPPSWLPMPTVTGSEQILATLFPVYDSSVNNISFTLSDNSIVDWGDGIVENFSAESQATHNYTYSSISSSTDTPFGYRQALIKITPQAGATLTAIGFIDLLTTGGLFLDIVASGPSLRIYAALNLPMLQHAKILCFLEGGISGSSLVSLETGQNTFLSPDIPGFLFFGPSPKLKYMTPFLTTGITNFSGMFQGCSSLERIPEISFNQATNMTNCFKGCSSLTYVPTITLSGTCNFNSCFSGCTSLQTLNITGNVSNINSCFSSCDNLLSVPPLNISACGPMTSPCNAYTRRFRPFGAISRIYFPAGVKFGRTELVEIMNNLGNTTAGTTLKISEAYGFPELTDAEKLIATNKGWAIE